MYSRVRVSCHWLVKRIRMNKNQCICFWFIVCDIYANIRWEWAKSRKANSTTVANAISIGIANAEIAVSILNVDIHDVIANEEIFLSVQ